LSISVSSARLRAMEERPQTRFAYAPDGVSLAYQVLGDGPLDLLWGTTGAFAYDLLWDEPSFAHLARRLAGFSRTIWLSPRGIGASGGHWSQEFGGTNVNDLSAVLDDCQCQRVTLVGPGPGGQRAIRYAHTHPERVRSLILIEACAHYKREPDYPIGYPESALTQALTNAPQQWGTGAQLEVVAPSRASDPLFKERYARIERLGLPPNETAALFRAGAMADTRPLLPNLKVPTLVLHRQGDRFIRVEAGRYLGESIPGAKYVELPGDDYLFFVGDVDAIVDEIEEFLTGGHQPPEGEVVTATILFTDIVSSTEQSARLGHRRWSRLIEDHDTAVRSTLQRYRGNEVKNMGDGFLATFDATTRAVRAALDIVRAASAMGLEVRAGVHTGEVDVRPDDVVGLPVNIAKRICDQAGSEEVFVSRAVTDLAGASGIVFSQRGEHDLKGVPGTWMLYAVEA
jgi:class 3 adenylate cyclase/pimeloyl-ACP methyl ester carboxylesterase